MQARAVFHALRCDRTHDPRKRSDVPRKRLRGAAGVALLTAGSIGLSALPAVAALGHVGSGIEISGILSTGNAWLGAVEGTAEAEATGWLSWCITAGYDAPSGTNYDALDYVDDPELAWIVQNYESVDTELNRAAISYLMHTRHETGTDLVSAETRIADYSANAPQSVKDQAAAYLAEATAQAGPFSAATGDQTYTTAQRAGQITIHPLVGANGAPIVGKSISVTLNGPVVVDTNSNGKADADETATTWSGLTQAEDIHILWAGVAGSDPNATVTWNTTYSGLPRTTLTKLSASGQVQDTLTYGLRGPSDPEELTVPGTPFDVVMDFAVTGLSQVAEKVIDLGESAGDTLHLDAAEGDTWIDIDGDFVDVPVTATLFDVGDTPVDSPTDVPADAVVLETQTLVADGPGDLVATPTVQTEGRFVTWVWSTNKAAMPDETRDFLREDWSDQFGMADETTSVRHQIEIDSDLGTRETKSGTYLVDDIFVAGFPDDHGEFPGAASFAADVAEITHTAYFFPEGLDVTDENLSQATVLTAVSTDAENGFFASIGSTKWKVVTDESGNATPGTYSVVSSFAGDDRTAPFTSSVTDVTEQYIVLPEDLVVTTQIQTDRDVVDGANVAFTDDTIVTGTIPDGAITVTNDLFKWKTADGPVCTADTLVAAGEPITVNAAGTVTSQPITTKVEGGYSFGFVETARNSAGQVVSRGECGAASETVSVPASDIDSGGAASDQSSALAHTGGEIWPLAVLAALLLGAGAAVVVLHRRKLAAALDAQAQDGMTPPSV